MYRKLNICPAMSSALPPPSCLPPGLSIVVPVYRSSASLEPLVNALDQARPNLGPAVELILVNDCSPDNSLAVIRELSAKHEWIRHLDMMRNYGQHNALLAGIRAARFDRIITMDDDLQHPPEELPKLIAALTPEVDVVYGCPYTQQHGLLRDFASFITKLTLQKAIGAQTARMVSALRIFRTQIRDAFVDYNHPNVNIDVLLTWGTSRFHAIHVRHDERTIGQSTYSITKLINHSINMLTGFSVLPLQIASVVGFIFTLFGMVILAFVVGRFLWSGTSVPGFPFLASVIAIFSGAQLFALGVIGEYLARMHFRSMNKPAYTLRQHEERASDE